MKRTRSLRFLALLMAMLTLMGTLCTGVAFAADDGLTLEVNRCCTDGTRNACTMLYGAATRASKALGYKRLVTYTLQSEPGMSLRASNWKFCGGGVRRNALERREICAV